MSAFLSRSSRSTLPAACRFSIVSAAAYLGWLILLATTGGAIAETRVALVVGNSAYVHTPALANPANDAAAMTKALEGAGFQVIEARDADRRGFDAALRSFTERLAGADVAVFFYAGHGLQVGAQNYLVPVDAKLERERDLEFEAVRLDFVLRQMEIDREGRTSIVFLDACRDNPLSRNLARSMGTRSAAIGRGLAATATGVGTFIAFATQPGNVALDGAGGNSPFTAALTRHMLHKGRNLPATMIEVRKDVIAATNGKQVPWDHSALTGDFTFLAGGAAPTPGETVAAPPSSGGADLAALQERLARLEAEAKAREAAPAPSGAMMTADGIKLAELRARATSLDELVKDLQRKLFDARREEGQTTDPAEKQKRQKRSIDIQMEWTRRGLDLKKVREDIAALEGPSAQNEKPTAAAATVPPVTPKSNPNASAANFEASDNVRLEGAELRTFKAPNPDACRNACAAEATCAGYQHGKKAANMGQCQLFSAISARHEDQQWRSGVRVAESEATKSTSANHAFVTFPDSIVLGDAIKRTRVDTVDACITVCRHTPGCVAGAYDAGAYSANCTVFPTGHQKAPGFIGVTAFHKR